MDHYPDYPTTLGAYTPPPPWGEYNRHMGQARGPMRCSVDTPTVLHSQSDPREPNCHLLDKQRELKPHPLNFQCVDCCQKVRPGHEVTPNCGFSDDGGRHEAPFTQCKNGTFNDGTFAYCRVCKSCAPGYNMISPCTTTTDSQCEELRIPTTGIPLITSWRAILTTNSTMVLLPTGHDKHCSAIMSAPLQTVLDNLDVLEELVILLDPEGHAVKNTKHLASLCSFPATWITYTYSMKDSKSPLKAVLEGVTSRHPEWTVGHLAKLLRQMERNDAIALLARLRVNDMDV
ncbi:IGF-like family receptor 1 [Collichthys lucidus]|uniref:IGF-like family receptor 1 n=2 Tax=Collichthys lucidus TaxID=240159 RepID=A0A4U5V2F7_COLLU|nr:IGF-like family receptor 1 [Collichthys lucidus]